MRGLDASSTSWVARVGGCKVVYRPSLDHERELAEAVSFEQELTSVDMVRGCVRVAWCSDDTRADYFCTRELDDDHIRMSERAIIAQLRSEAYSRLQSVVGES